jgi:hypothetical protein
MEMGLELVLGARAMQQKIASREAGYANLLRQTSIIEAEDIDDGRSIGPRDGKEAAKAVASGFVRSGATAVSAAMYRGRAGSARS